MQAFIEGWSSSSRKRKPWLTKIHNKPLFFQPTLASALRSLPSRANAAQWWARRTGWLLRWWPGRRTGLKWTSGLLGSWPSRWWKENLHTWTRTLYEWVKCLFLILMAWCSANELICSFRVSHRVYDPGIMSTYGINGLLCQTLACFLDSCSESGVSWEAALLSTFNNNIQERELCSE